MLSHFPKYFSSKAMMLYFIILGVVTILFINHTLPWYLILIAVVELVSFFYFTNLLTSKWAQFTSKKFLKKLFWTAFIIRICWVMFSYFFYISMTGYPFEFGAADSMMYHNLGLILSNSTGFSTWQSVLFGMDVSDKGYPLLIGVLYKTFGAYVLPIRLLKAFLSAITCILIYKLSVRNFGEGIGRMAALFCMLMPNLIYYCGLHLKETEMLFLTVLFIERVDYVLRVNRFALWWTVFTVFIGLLLFFFRTVLGAVAFLSFFSALVFSTRKIITSEKKIMLGIIVFLVMALALSDQINNELSNVWQDKDTNQSVSMEWRSERIGGNEYAKYAGAFVFAPLIFTIPFPTMVNTPGQENIQLIHGGNYVKNITSGFTLLALFLLIFTGDWRNYVLLLSFMCGYLLIITFSAFAQSERFHIPALPFELMFAAYGVSIFKNKHKTWFTVWLVFIFVSIIGWNFLKLSGRGL